MVHVLGIEHGAQAYPLVGDIDDAYWEDDEDFRKMRQFRNVARRLLGERSIGGVFEEVGSEGALLRKNEGSETILQREARERDLSHVFLPDLTVADLSRIGLPSLHDKDLTESQRAAKHSARERMWADFIRDEGVRLWERREAIVAVGAAHAESLASELQKRGVNASATVIHPQ